MDLTLEDAFQGVTRRLAIKHDGHTRTVDVRIPAGVGDGSRVRVSGEGEQGGGGGGSGDLYLRIKLQPHPVFTRKGPDLHAEDPRAGDHRGARRRSRRADDHRQAPAPAGAADDPERTGVPPERSRDAAQRKDTGAWRSVCDVEIELPKA